MKSIKKIAMLSLCLIVVLFMTAGCADDKTKDKNGNKTNEKGQVVNQNSGVISSKLEDGFKFENTSLVTENKTTTYIVYMTNTNNKEVKVSKVKVTMKDKEKKEVTSIDINVNRTLKSKETLELSASIEMDLTKVTTIEYEIL